MFLKFSEPVYIVDGVRTPVGNPYRSLKSFSVVKLASCVIGALIRRNKIKKTSVDEVIMGNAVSAGLGQNFARQATLGAGLPERTPAYSVNNVCGAGLQSVIIGAQSIRSHDRDLLIVGGAESATHSPFLVKREDEGRKNQNHHIDSSVNDGLMCQLTGKHMGELMEVLSKKHGVSRETQDYYALESHRRVVKAQSLNKFDQEIVAVKTSKGKRIEKDDRPRRNMKMERLKMIKPAFTKRGRITAGNSSIPCDGAAAVLLASKKAVKKFKLKPRARIVGYVSIAVSPERTFESAIPAIRECLKQCHKTISDIDLFEISESFASQAIITKNQLKIPYHKLNIFGGDIAFGHPLGAAGTRVLVTLIHALKDQDLHTGLASVCYGGGGAIAMIVERES